MRKWHKIEWVCLWKASERHQRHPLYRRSCQTIADACKVLWLRDWKGIVTKKIWQGIWSNLEDYRQTSWCIFCRFFSCFDVFLLIFVLFKKKSIYVDCFFSQSYVRTTMSKCNSFVQMLIITLTEKQNKSVNVYYYLFRKVTGNRFRFTSRKSYNTHSPQQTQP